MLDILCIGDSVIDIFLKVPESNPNFKLEDTGNKVLMNLGEKISLEKYLMDIGGNATNTAVGISRLSLNVGLCAEIGQDEFSAKIINRLKEENINRNFIRQTSDAKTSLSVILSFSGERTIFSEHVLREHAFDFESLETKFIYLTSLGNKWEEAYEKTLNFVINKKPILAFNPGTLQIEKKDKLILDIIEKSDYLFLNKEEAEEILYGKELDLETKDRKKVFKKLLFGLKSLGAKNVIITDSTNGSYACDYIGNLYFLGIVQTNVIEKTGAGDSYAAGFISAIIDGLTLQEAMIYGAINSSSVIEKIGALEGLLGKKELLEKLNSLKNFTPEKF